MPLANFRKKQNASICSRQIEWGVDGGDERHCGGFGLDGGGPGVGILGDWWPGVVVGGQDDSGCDQGDCFEAVLGAHGEQIADGDDQAIDAVARDPFHVAEDGGIAGVIDAIGLAGRSMDFDEPSSGGPAIGTVGET